MVKKSELNKKSYKTGEVAKLLGISPKTVYKYGKEGRIPFRLTETGRRAYAKEDVIEILEREGLLYDDSKDERRDVIYARVSSNEQKQKGDLDRQALRIIEEIQDLKNPLILKEVGSGLNDKRKKLLELIRMIERDEVNRIFITYKDRLTRFGFEYLKEIVKAHKSEIIIIEKEDERTDKAIEEELVEDMMSLIASFSGKFYGLRSRRSKNGGN